MRRSGSILAGFLAVGAITAGLVLFSAGAPPAAPAPQAKLAVLVVFDQMRGDYVARWRELFVKDGFRRLQAEGAWFSNCHYPLSDTLTAVGHTSLVTGCGPDQHGIIANDWYDRKEAARVNAVRTPRHRPVPPPTNAANPVDGSAPLRRLQPTVGEMLHKATGAKGKVVSLSIKDRAAILLAALRDSIVYWFSTSAGMFVTSDYYTDRLHGWVDEFNRQKFADRWFGRDWVRLRPELDYARHSGPDDVAGEGVGYHQGRTFPHPITGGLKAVGREYYDAFNNTPHSSEMLVALAKRAIDAEKLGQRDAVDLLFLSFSANDLVGHCWGPDSQEVLDLTLRSDLIVKELLDYLDARVGRGKYFFVVCSDHGVGPIPELARAQGKQAGRVSPTLLTSQAARFLDDTFGKKNEKLPWIEATAGHWLYLNHGVLKERSLTSAQVETALAGWLVKQPGVQAAYTRSQLRAGRLQDDPIGAMAQRSFHPENSGDVLAILKPYHLLSEPITSRLDAYRTGHGSPHPHDTHVPLLVYGPGVAKGTREDRVTPFAVAAILASALGIDPPPAAAPLPKGLFTKLKLR